jgi:hypothetical protein
MQEPANKNLNVNSKVIELHIYNILNSSDIVHVYSNWVCYVVTNIDIV